MEIVGEDRPATVKSAVVLGAAALGAAVPILFLGRGGMAAVAGLAVVLVVATADRTRLLRDLGAALRAPLGLAVIVTFALWLVSVAGSIDIARSAGVWLRMAVLLVVGVALVSALRRDPNLLIVALKALVVTSLACAALALVATLLWPAPYLLLHSETAGEPHALAAAYLKPYGAAVACLMPVALWAGARLGRGWWMPAVAFQPLAVAFMFAVESRASLIAGALGVGVLACWFVARYGRPSLAALVAMGVVAVVVATFLTNVRGNQIEPVTGIPVWLVDAHRQAIWSRGLDYAIDAPVFGWGFDVIDRLPGADTIVSGSTQEYIPAHPHNWMIEVAVETGVVGFAALVGTLVLLSWGTIRALRRDGAAGAAMLALLVAYFVICSISFSFWAFWWQATFVLLAAMVTATLTPGYLSRGFGRTERTS